MQQKRSWLKILSITLVIAILFVGGVSFYVLERLVGRTGHETVEQRDARHAKAHEIFFKQENGKRISFQAEDGVELSGVLIERKNPKGVIILCHGYHRDKENMVHYIDLFKDYTLFLFDFRVSGESAGFKSSIGCHEYRDVIAASTYISKHVCNRKNTKVILYGVSMGAAASIKALALYPHIADGAILDSSYACLDDVIAHVFTKQSGLPYYPFFPVMSKLFRWYHGHESYKMKPEEYIKAIRVPLLIIHSATDAFTPSDHSVRLYAACVENEHAELWMGPPAQHTRLYLRHPEVYQKWIREFLARVH